MIAWQVEFSENAEDDLAVLDRQIRWRVIDRLEWLSNNFDNIIPIPLGGRWKEFFKFRVGDWRIIYEIKSKENLLIVHYIDHRSKIYRRR